MLPKVEHLAGNSLHRGQHWISGVAMGDRAVFALVLLIGKVKDDPMGVVDCGNGCRDSVGKASAGLQRGVLQPDRMIVFATIGVFTRAQEPEKTNNEGIGNGLATFSGGGSALE